MSSGEMENTAIVNGARIVNFWNNKHYEVLNPELGKGAFGRTLLVKDCDFDIEQVAKVYSPDKSLTKEDCLRFFQFFKSEIKLLHSINHKNIVRIFSAHLYESSMSGIIIMEYIKGKTLDDYLKDYNEYWWNLDGVFVQLIDTFAYLESKGIVHRDIRASNIMVDQNDVAKVIDFGFGKGGYLSDNNCKDNSVLSVVNHSDASISPEEEQSGEYDSLTDMFYLGELLHRLISKNEDAVNDFRYMPILEKMMSYSRSSRYKSFAEVRSSIDEWQAWSDVSETDRAEYGKFADIMMSILVERSADSAISVDEESLLSKLDAVLEANAFECYLPNPSSLTRIFISGQYRYKSNTKVPLDTLRSFRKWFSQLNTKKRSMVLSSLRSRLSNIKIENPFEVPPF